MGGEGGGGSCIHFVYMCMCALSWILMDYCVVFQNSKARRMSQWVRSIIVLQLFCLSLTSLLDPTS